MERPAPCRWKRPRIVGMDANYVAGFVFSDGQHVGQDLHARIQTFGKRQKHTFKEISDLVGKALRQVDWSRIDVLVLEKLRHVKTGRRGTFSRRFNRRLSHWLCKASEQPYSAALRGIGDRREAEESLENVAVLQSLSQVGPAKSQGRAVCVRLLWS